MRITRRDLSVLLILIGIVSIFLTYQMYYKGKQEEIEQLNSQVHEVQSQIAELQPKVEKEKMYRDDAKKFADEVKETLKEFKVAQRYEDGIMYMEELENEFNLAVPTFTVSESNIINSAEGSLDGTPAAITLGSSAVTLSGLTTYDDFKNIVTYIYDDKECKRDIQSAVLTYDRKNDEIGLSMNYNVYVMNDGTGEYEKAEIPEVDMSVDSIFGKPDEEKEE